LYGAKKEEGAWTIPKGLLEADEPPKVAAEREVLEEIGLVLHAPLTRRLDAKASGEILLIWLAEADLDLTAFRATLLRSNGRQGPVFAAWRLNSIASPILTLRRRAGGGWPANVLCWKRLSPI